MGAYAYPNSEDHVPSGTLRILSVNVNTLKEERLDQVCRLAEETAAQVLVLQETRHRGNTNWIKWGAAR